MAGAPLTREPLTGAHLHFDCAAGAAGDMALGALLDLGVPREVLAAPLDRMGIGGYRLRARERVAGGIRATDVTVDVDGAGDGAGDAAAAGEGGHGHHHHHHYRDIRRRILEADLGESVTRRALDIFDRIARAEAAIHGVSEDAVALHEVGAIDSIVDVVAAAAALAHLEPEAVTAASVAVGHGSVETAHGRLPVPAPATVAILREVGAPIEGGGLARELCTPTGAAILASAVTSWTPMPPLVPIAAGYGAGDADLSDRPNVMRAIAGRPASRPAGDGGRESVYRIEANVDDMRPELAEAALDALTAAGAVEAYLLPAIMKRSRPAVVLAALAPEAALEACLRALFSETTTIGARYERVSRRVLSRREVEVDTPYGSIPIKLAYDGGARPVNAAPEYRACRDAARRAGAPVKEVMDAAIAAYRQG